MFNRNQPRDEDGKWEDSHTGKAARRRANQFRVRVVPHGKKHAAFPQYHDGSQWQYFPGGIASPAKFYMHHDKGQAMSKADKFIESEQRKNILSSAEEVKGTDPELYYRLVKRAEEVGKPRPVEYLYSNPTEDDE